VLALEPLSACAPARPRVADLVGAWRNDDGDVVLRLEADGSGRGDQLETEQGPATGACRWRIRDDGKVVVDFSSTPSALVSTQVFDVGGGGQRLSYRDPSDDITVVLHR